MNIKRSPTNFEYYNSKSAKKRNLLYKKTI